MALSGVVERRAYLSKDGVYRYSLTRAWDDGQGALVWIMLNPSVADDKIDDPTMLKVMHITRREGYAQAIVLNLYALRSSDPKVLRTHPDPIGPENDSMLKDCAQIVATSSECALVVAWGTGGGQRAQDVLHGALRGAPALCLGQTKDGYPKHPCRLANATPLVPFMRIPRVPR